MAIECDHPRPRVQLPGYVPRRMAWQVPQYIPDLPPNAARVIREALTGVYQELSRQGQVRNVIPLEGDIYAAPGSVITGVANGQTVTLLPPGALGYTDPVSLLITDVTSPMTVVGPDGTATTIGTAGAYDFEHAGQGTFETNPGGSVLAGGITTDRILGRDTAGTGAVELIALTAPLEFTGAQAIRIASAGITATHLAASVAGAGLIGGAGTPLAVGAGTGVTVTADAVSVTTPLTDGDKGDVTVSSNGTVWTVDNDAITNAKLRNSAGLSVIGRSTNSSGDPADITASAAQQYFRVNAAGTALEWRTLPGAPIYYVEDYGAVGNGVADDTAAINLAIAAANAAPGAIVLMGAHRITAALTTITGNNIMVRGRGPFNGGSRIQVDSASAIDVFTFDGGQYCGITDVWITGMRVYTAGWAIRVHDSFRFYADHLLISQICFAVEVFRSTLTHVRRIYMDDLYGVYGIYAHGDATAFNHAIKIEDCVGGTNYGATVTGTANTWASGQTITAGALRFSNGAIYQAATSGTTGATAPSGIPGTTTTTAHTATVSDGGVSWTFAMPLGTWYLQGSWSHTFEVINCGALQGGYGVSVEDDTPGANSTPFFTRCHNVQIDHPFARGVRLAAGVHARFSQTFVTSVLEGVGIEIGSGYSGNWEFTGGEVYGCNRAGITIGAPHGVLLGVHIGAIGTVSSNTRDCIEVASGVQHFSITGCSGGVMYNGDPATSRYGISIASGCDNYTVVGNRFVGNLTAAILNTPGLALTRVVRNNVPDTTSSVPDGDYGDITVSSSGTVWNIDPNVVGDAELRQGTACSVIGRSVNSTGNVADIQGATNDRVLARSSNTLAFQQVTNAMRASMGAGTVHGRQIDAGSGVPVDLTGLEVGELWRKEFFQLGSTLSIETPGTYNNVALDARCSHVFINPAAGDVTITGWALGSDNTGGFILVQKEGTDGRVILAHNTGSTAANQHWCPNDESFVLSRSNDCAILWYGGGRWRVAAASRFAPDRDYGDVTVTSGGTVWTIDNGVVTSAKMADMGALTVKGRALNSLGVPGDIAAVAGSDSVLRESASGLGFGSIATGGILNGAVTLAKMANLAASRFIGQSEGAATGAPIALTPTQAVAIIDGEDATWTGTHVFNGPALTANVTTADVLLGANPGAVGLFAGQATANVNNGDIVLNATSGIALAAGGTAVTTVPDGTLDLNATTVDLDATTIDIDATGNIGINTPGNITIASSSTGNTQITGGSSGLVLTAGSTIGLNSPTVLNNTLGTGTAQTSSTVTLNNFALGSTPILRLSGSGWVLTGIVPSVASGGQVLLIANVHASVNGNILMEATGSSSAANCFTGPGTSRQVRPGEIVLTWYDSTSSRWRLLSRLDAET